MYSKNPSPFILAVHSLRVRIEASVDESERLRRPSLPIMTALAEAGLFRLWIPSSLGGEEADAATLVRVIEEVSRINGATGWCLALGATFGVMAGYLPTAAARKIFACDPFVITGGSFRPSAQALAVDGGYRVTGRWPFGSGCQHCSWLLGGARIMDGNQPRLGPDGKPVTRMMYFPSSAAEIIDTWDTVGLRGTGSHDFAVTDVFVPNERSLSFREPPSVPGPLYALPSISLFAVALAAVPLGIARHAIEILTEIAATKTATRSQRTLQEDAALQANLGRAEGILRAAGAFLYEALSDAWQVASAGRDLTVSQRATLWLAATHAAASAKQVAELTFSVGGSSSLYTANGLERCFRDIHAAGQHITMAAPNFQMAGQALLGADMRATPLLYMDDRCML